MKIINWQNTLFFPDDIELQYNAIHLLRWYVCFLLLLSVPSNVPHDKTSGHSRPLTRSQPLIPDTSHIALPKPCPMYLS